MTSAWFAGRQPSKPVGPKPSDFVEGLQSLGKVDRRPDPVAPRGEIRDHAAEDAIVADSTTSGSTTTAGSSLGGVLTVLATGDQGIDGILKGVCWADDFIGYCDPDAVDDYASPYPKELLPAEISQLSAQQLAAVRLALDADAGGVSGIASAFSVEGFTRLSIGYAGSGTGTGTIAVINRSSTSTATGYYPAASSYGGDVFFGGSGDAPALGNYDWVTVLHEMGHALGLKHGQDTGTYGAMPSQVDSMEYSVMTYRSYLGQALGGGYTNEQWGYAQTYMMYDIAALQHMYGADFSAQGGDTVYRWTPGSGDTWIDGQVALHPGDNRIFLTIWDGGGSDTYDLSAYTTGVTVDLNPGKPSVFSTAQLADLDDSSSDAARVAGGNVYNALLFKGDTASLIENAVGGSGDDRLAGNQAANRLTGGTGKDALYGATGADTLVGGLGRDSLYGGIDGDRDLFVFISRYDSKVGRARDVLYDFTGIDGIDLRGIDARASTTGTNEAFYALGTTAMAHTAWWTPATDGVYLRADVSGDRKADFEILVRGVNSLALDDVLL